MTSKLETLKESECRCNICQSMCKRPCWGTPDDIQKIIDAGYEDRLMKDFWGSSQEGNIYILSPALKGSESKASPFFPESELGCTFFDCGKCQLHNKKLKPTEGKLASCTESEYKTDPTVHELVALKWDTDKGRKMVKDWCEKRNIALDENTNPLENIESLKGTFQLLSKFDLNNQNDR
jgi:hypothetical protein